MKKEVKYQYPLIILLKFNPIYKRYDFTPNKKDDFVDRLFYHQTIKFSLLLDIRISKIACRIQPLYENIRRQ